MLQGYGGAGHPLSLKEDWKCAHKPNISGLRRHRGTLNKMESFYSQILEALDHGTLDSWSFEIKTLGTRLDLEVTLGVI